jgi:hypothetical protein
VDAESEPSVGADQVGIHGLDVVGVGSVAA